MTCDFVAAGHGPVTGRCVPTDRPLLAARGVTVCQITSWCPVEDDRIVKGERTAVNNNNNNFLSIPGSTNALISGSEEHTVYIKNSIRKLSIIENNCPN